MQNMDLSFGYANSRVKGMKSKLLGSEAIRGLFSISAVSEYVDMLEKTAYREAFVEASTKHEGIELVLAALRLDFDRTIAKILRIVPPKARAKTESLLSLWEIRPLTVILAAKASGLPLEQTYIGFLDQKGKVKADRLVKAATFEAALRELGNLGYNEISSKALKVYSKSGGDYKQALRMIGRYYYDNLALHAKAEPEEQVRNILKAELDYYNSTTALRMKNAGLALEAIELELVSPSPGGMPLSIAKAKSIGDAVEIVQESLNCKPDVFEAFKRDSSSISDVEIAIEKSMFRKILSSTRISVLSLGTVFGYVYLKRREIENLRAVALSLQFPAKDAIRKSVYSLHG